MLGAKRRARTRKGSGGGTLFIVAMTLAVLASLGVYALRSAATEVRVSGNARQAVQTHYLAEYGVSGAAQVLASGGALQLSLLNASPDVGCTSLYGAPVGAASSSVACRRLGAAEMASAWGQPALAPYGGTPSSPGSLGPVPVSGDFYVEVTDPGPAPSPPGYGLGAGGAPLCFRQVTVTSTGVTRPQAVDNPAALYGGQGIETVRARVIAGPVPCP